jgi:hypothetical protein
LETNSGPLSLRRSAGAPLSLTRRDRTAMTRGERIRPSTSIASPSLVNHARQGREFVPSSDRLCGVATMFSAFLLPFGAPGDIPPIAVFPSMVQRPNTGTPRSGWNTKPTAR